MDLSHPSPSTSSLLPPSDANRTGDKRLRDYLAEEVHNELWEGQVEATKKKQRERRKEESIIEWGVQYPSTFLSLLLPPFLEPSTRLPISALLVHFLQANPSLSSFLADSELLEALLTSLQLDTSTTVFQLQVTILQVTLTGAPSALASRLPEVFVILARAICWKERHHLLDDDEGDPGGSGISVMRAPQSKPLPSHRRSPGDSDSDEAESDEENSSTTPKKVLDWKRLDFSFDSAPAPPPDTFPLLSYLYYVWPCNVLGFLRDPAKYLHEKERLTNIEGKEWEEVFDRQEVGDRSKALLRQLTIHPDILLFDAKSELLDHRKYKLSPREIIADTSLLRVVAPPPAEPLLRSTYTSKLGRDGVSSVVPRPYDELVAERKEFTFRKIEDDRKRRLGQVEYLTREVLMLENELMFEVYLKNFYIAHNKRLHQDVKLGAGALSEQQAFRNLLKNHEQTNETLQTELRKLKERADTEKTNTKAKRDADLAKYTRTKETLDKMTAQLTPLRNELQLVKEDRDRTKAELAEVKNERFELQNQLREIQPEVDAIHDFKEKIMKLEMVGKAAQGDRRVRRQQEEAIQKFDGKILALQQLLDLAEKEQYASEKQIISLQEEVTDLRFSNHILTTRLAATSSTTSTTHQPHHSSSSSSIFEEQRRLVETQTQTISSLKTEILDLKVKIEELNERLADSHVSGKTVWEVSSELMKKEVGGEAPEGGGRGATRPGSFGAMGAGPRRGSAAGMIAGTSSQAAAPGSYRGAPTLGGGVMGVF